MEASDLIFIVICIVHYNIKPLYKKYLLFIKIKIYKINLPCYFYTRENVYLSVVAPMVNNPFRFFMGAIDRYLNISEYFPSAVIARFLRRVRAVEMLLDLRVVSNKIQIADFTMYLDLSKPSMYRIGDNSVNIAIVRYIFRWHFISVTNKLLLKNAH